MTVARNPREFTASSRYSQIYHLLRQSVNKAPVPKAKFKDLPSSPSYNFPCKTKNTSPSVSIESAWPDLSMAPRKNSQIQVPRRLHRRQRRHRGKKTACDPPAAAFFSAYNIESHSNAITAKENQSHGAYSPMACFRQPVIHPHLRRRFRRLPRHSPPRCMDFFTDTTSATTDPPGIT